MLSVKTESLSMSIGRIVPFAAVTHRALGRCWAFGLLVLLLVETRVRGDDTAVPPGTLVGHAGAVMMGTFTPDGVKVITASTDQSARLWDPATGLEVRRYAEHTGPLYALAVSRDGRTLVTGAQDNTLRVWDVPLNAPVRVFHQHPLAIRGLARSPEGSTLLTASADKMLNVLPISLFVTGAVPATPAVAVGELRSGHLDELLTVDARNDGAQYATADRVGRMLLWNPYLKLPQRELLGHAGRVESVRFLGNNQQLLSAGDDGMLRLWQLLPNTARTSATFPVEFGEVALLNNQPIALCGLTDGTLRAVNLTDDKTVLEYPQQDFKLTQLAVAPNNSWLALAGEHGLTTLLNYNDGALRGMVGEHVAAITDIAVHADAVRFATASADGAVRLWQQPQPSIEVKGHAAPLRGLAAASSGQWFASIADDQTARIWGLNGAAQRQLGGHAQPLRAIAIRDDDALLATGDAAGVVWVWNASNGAVEGYLPAHQGAVTALVFSADRNSLVTAGADGRVRSWTFPLPKQQPATPEEAPQPAWEFAVPGNQSLTAIYRTAGDAGYIGLLATGSELVRLKVDGTALAALTVPGRVCKSLEVSRDGRFTLAVDDQGTAHLWSADATALAELPLGAGTVAARFNKEGTELVVSDAKPRVRLFDVASKRCLEELSCVEPVVDAVWAGTDQRTIACMGPGNDAAVVQRSLLRLLETRDPQQPDMPLQPANALQFTPDQQHLLCGTAAGNIRQWNINDGSLVRTLTGAKSSIQQVLIAPNQQWVLTLAADNSIQVWQLGDGNALQTFNVTEGAQGVTISADSTRVATAHLDGFVRVWDLASGRLLETLSGHAGPVVAIHFLPDGQTLVTAGTDKSLRQTKTSIIRAMPVSQGKLLHMVLYNNGAQAVACDDLGRVFMTELSNGTEVRHYQWGALPAVPVANPAVVAVAAPPQQQLQPTVVAARVDNQRIAAGTTSGDVVVWNVSNGETPLLRFQVPAAVTAINYSPDNLKLAVTCADSSVHILVPRFQVGSRPWSYSYTSSFRSPVSPQECCLPRTIAQY